MAFRNKSKSFHVIRAELHRKSLRYMTSYSSTPTHAYFSAAGLTKVLNNLRKGFSRNDLPLSEQPTNITFRNLPFPFVKRSFNADPNTAGWILLFLSTSRAQPIHCWSQPGTQCDEWASRINCILFFLPISIFAWAFFISQVFLISSSTTLVDRLRMKFANSFVPSFF